MKFTIGKIPCQENKADGFTLVETMVASMILGILFVAVFGLLDFNIATTKISRENTRATQILLDKLECLRLYQWQQLTNSAFLLTTFTNWTYESTNSGAVGQGVEYIGDIKITTPVAALTDTAYSSNLAAVKVSVSWNSGDTNQTHTRSMSTYFSRVGIENTIQLH